jgi:WD40 repeat protein
MASESPSQSIHKKASSSARFERPTPKHTIAAHGDYVSGKGVGPIAENYTRCFIFLHDNVHIVSGSSDGTMRKWDCDTGLLVGEPWISNGGNVWALALSPDGKTIACGRGDGSVQRWNTDGRIIEGVWTGHNHEVDSLSWSPSGCHIASGSGNIILIRKAESGEVEVGPINTKQGWVHSLAYSPSGDRIASGGKNATICIWDSNTGELAVSPIEDLGHSVTSVVWSSDSSKLYSASDEFARVFDSVSGTELHRFEHYRWLESVVLSPNNVLACVGFGGVAQLWDGESHEPLGQPLGEGDDKQLNGVSFSQDGRFLAYRKDDKDIILWMVEDIIPDVAVRASTTRIPS